MAMLSNGDLFCKDEHFRQLQPIYNVSSRDIEAYIKAAIERGQSDACIDSSER